MSKEAMKLAQATLEAIATHCDLACVVTPDGAFYLQPAITALREALAEQPAQRTWVGLTDMERHDIMIAHYARTELLARAIEAKLEEKNT